MLSRGGLELNEIWHKQVRDLQEISAPGFFGALPPPPPRKAPTQNAPQKPKEEEGLEERLAHHVSEFQKHHSAHLEADTEEKRTKSFVRMMMAQNRAKAAAGEMLRHTAQTQRGVDIEKTPAHIRDAGAHMLALGHFNHERAKNDAHLRGQMATFLGAHSGPHVVTSGGHLDAQSSPEHYSRSQFQFLAHNTHPDAVPTHAVEARIAALHHGLEAHGLGKVSETGRGHFKDETGRKIGEGVQVNVEH